MTEDNWHDLRTLRRKSTISTPIDLDRRPLGCEIVHIFEPFLLVPFSSLKDSSTKFMIFSVILPISPIIGIRIEGGFVHGVPNADSALRLPNMKFFETNLIGSDPLNSLKVAFAVNEKYQNTEPEANGVESYDLAALVPFDIFVFIGPIRE